MLVVLVSCVKSKQPRPSKAADLYTSALFRGAMEYAQSLAPDVIYILSAKHGLLRLDDEIEPYEETLNGKSVAELRAWTDRVAANLREHHNLASDHFVLLAGQSYRKYLLHHLSSYEVPLAGLGLGKQLSFYARRR